MRKIKVRNVMVEDAASDAEHDLRKLIRNNPQYMRYATALQQRGYQAAKDSSKLLQTDDPAKFFVYSVKHDISSLHKKELGKYIYGVGRMALDGDIGSSRDILKLNQVLEVLGASEELRSRYNKDFNGLSTHELFDELEDAYNEYNRKMKGESGDDYVRNEDYMIEKVNDFYELQHLEPYCDWCIVHNEDSFDQYITDQGNKMYLIYNTSFMMLDRDDEGYKDSLISLIVDEDYNLVCSTSRLNHDIKTGDRTYSFRELSQIIGANIVNEMQKLG